MNKLEKILYVLSWIIKINLAILFVLSVYYQQYQNTFLVSLALIISFLPIFVEKNYKITLPLEFELLILFFTYSALILGEIEQYYIKYWWWDLLLHTISGLIFGLVGFLIIFVLNDNKKVKLHLAKRFVAIFAFTFSLSMGALWEIIEFVIDQVFDLNMQKSGIVDTMTDLIVDTIGALIISISSYYYILKVKVPVFYHFISNLVEKNPHIFRRKKNKDVKNEN
ncbi:MAG: hypothetical protein KC589_09610 [Nanoarchaeota archaeon]|nr:hypothetical protein [Nanoarchaeota archaeon]